MAIEPVSSDGRSWTKIVPVAGGDRLVERDEFGFVSISRVLVRAAAGGGTVSTFYLIAQFFIVK